MITYRLADRKSDLAFARKVHHAAYQDVVERQFGSWDRTLQDSFFLEGWSRSPHQLVLLDETPIGVVSFGEVEDCLYIYEIQILPEYQGRGIGTQFLRERIAEAKALRKVLKLKVLRDNRAKHLYLRMGFVPYEENEVDIKMQWCPL